MKVDLGQKKGKITVEFASLVDLERILGTLAPGEGRVLEGGLADEEADDTEGAEGIEGTDRSNVSDRSNGLEPDEN